MNQVKTILFDFDGTIADTLPLVVEIANKTAKSWGFRELHEKGELEKLRGMTPFEVLKEFRIPLYKGPFLLKKIQHELYHSMDTIPVFPGMKEVIQKLEKSGHHLAIITSDTEENVKRFLKAHQITSFHSIHSVIFFFRKAQGIKNFIRQKSLNPDEIVYIGDEVSDITAAKKSGISCISVTWGFNTKKLLKEHGAEQLVDTPKELLNLIA